MQLDDVLARLGALAGETRAKVEAEALKATATLRWVPNPGPQTDAYFCAADELLYGGQAGGGKSDLLLGLAVTAHRRSLILRRIKKDALKLLPRLTEILGARTGYNGQLTSFRLAEGQQIDIGGCEYEDDKQRYKGDPHDLKAFDELSDFSESQYRFIIGWLRSTDPNQRCRIVGASNPPTRPEGLWIVKRWAAWLDPAHPRTARPGELRWYLTINGEDTEVDSAGPHMVDGRRERALSRSYIPAALQDNPDLAATNYASVLASLPDELRRAYGRGDFSLGLKDDDWQVIPSAWIEAAQQRWTPQVPQGTAMTAMAVDVAPGGGDATTLASRYGGWYAPVVSERHVDKDGNVVAGMVVRHRRDNCPVAVDVGGGWGGDAIIRLKDNGISVVAFNGVAASHAKARGGKLAFRNKRAESWWRFREALDPEQEGGSVIALPSDAELKADLASARWQLTPSGILIESKDDIKERIGRSPDKGDAVVMALSEGQIAVLREIERGGKAPEIRIGYSHIKSRLRGARP